MGGTDSGSHPGGAKKLLTAADGGEGESIDQYLGRTAGAAAPFRHIYLGAMANHNNASGDRHISYPSAGRSTPPEDSPARAFTRLFGAPGAPGGAGAADPVEASVLDAALADLHDLRGRLGEAERSKLDLHLEALRDVERRVKGLGGGAPTCKDPRPINDDDGALRLEGQALYAPENFPQVLRAQLDLAVLALACGLTRVAVIQASMHTSELIMSRFRGTEMYDPAFDMRSHQASHYGPRHDPGRREFRDYLAQRRWFVSQFAYLLGELEKRPAGGGTLLDGTIALLCSEVSDGNTHSHDDMPFVLAGGAGGALKTGRLLDYRGRRHADLLLSLAWAMGERMERFGQGGQGPLPGLLTLS